ncbi:hypothetical protein M406DRAFT_342924 [Cryphonectria parasitica EP155]|uniref:Alcohol acetyltransferase n=1 Tax=Cryphonectria parasitica (strain ATCC 38755 / EP155) TaxID=660469 RepID=A0A9P5CIH8_CRYP1|nr:uncharacterized protein M406DRAFT_342924 [Cryphonectria parasitica EP155]KAF3760729.1 hypothetical protein M406DRAFT_342924 [Cryphonectria parasitica EP155]
MSGGVRESGSSGNEAEPVLLKKLGYLDNFHLALNRLDQIRGTVISCRYTIPQALRGQERHDELKSATEAAVCAVVMDHPTLQVGVANPDSRKPSWVQLASLDLQHHIRWHFLDAEADIDKTLLQTAGLQVDTKFTDLQHRPGWFLDMLHQDNAEFLDIVYTWNHVHHDGMSGKIFHEDLLEALNSPTKTQKVHQHINKHTLTLPIQPPKMPPPLEDVCKLPLSFKTLARGALEVHGAAVFDKSPSLAHWIPIHLTPFQTQLRRFTIESDALGKIVRACRQHQTTVTGLLQALAFVSIASQLDEQTATAFRAGTALNLRRHMPTGPSTYPDFRPHRTMACYVSMLTHEFDVALVRTIRAKRSPSDAADAAATAKGPALLREDLLNEAWSGASSVRSEIATKIEKQGLRKDNLSLMRFIWDWRQYFMDLAKRPRQLSWVVSNIGVIDGTRFEAGTTAPSAAAAAAAAATTTAPAADDGPEESWSICQGLFAVSPETTNGGVCIAVLTAAGGQTCVTGTWQDCIFDVSLGERVMDDMERWLGQIASEL